MKKVFSLVVILFSIQSFAQSVIPCFTDELYVNAVRENPFLKIEEERRLFYVAIKLPVNMPVNLV